MCWHSFNAELINSYASLAIKRTLTFSIQHFSGFPYRWFSPRVLGPSRRKSGSNVSNRDRRCMHLRSSFFLFRALSDVVRACAMWLRIPMDMLSGTLIDGCKWGMSMKSKSTRQMRWQSCMRFAGSCSPEEMPPRAAVTSSLMQAEEPLTPSFVTTRDQLQRQGGEWDLNGMGWDGYPRRCKPRGYDISAWFE